MKGGVDITDRFNDRTLEIKVELTAGGGDQDKCLIVVDDRDWKIATPSTGDYLDIYLGYKEVGLAFMGAFEVDDVTFKGPPRSIQLMGLATGARSMLKAPTIKEFDNKTVGDILGSIAGKAGLGVAISGELAGQKLPYKNQIVSPNHLIHELERQYGAVAKVSNGKLMFVPRDGTNSASGVSLPTVVLHPEHFGAWQVRYNSRSEYSGARAAYHDPITHARKWVDAATSGEKPSNQVDEKFSIGTLFPSEAEAKAAVQSKVKAMKRASGQALFDLAKGDPWIRDMQTLVVTGMRDGIDGSWVIDKATHTYSKRTGIKSSLECKIPGDGSDFSDRADANFLKPQPGEITGQLWGEYLDMNPL